MSRKKPVRRSWNGWAAISQFDPTIIYEVYVTEEDRPLSNTMYDEKCFLPCRVIVESLNIVKRHTKPRPMKDSSRLGGPSMQAGGVIEKPAPVDVSNVMVVCPACDRPTRIGVTFKEIKGERVKIRVCRRADCGQEIDR